MLVATLALFVVSLGYGVVVPALPRLAGTGGAAAAAGELSIVYASYAAAKIAAQIPGGVWVDRAGHGRVLAIALVLYTASLLGFLVPLGPAWFAFVRAVEGAATGLVYPAVFARVLLTADEGAGRRLGTTVGVGSSGLLVGPVLGVWLGAWSAALPILVAAFLGVVALIAVWRSTSRAAAGDPRDRPAPAAAPIAAPVLRTIRAELSSLAALARSRLFVAAMLPIAFNKLTFSAYQGLLPLVGPEHLGTGPLGVALLFVLVGVVFAVAQPVAGVLSDRFAAPRIVLVVTPVLVGALGALALTERVVPFAALFGVHILGQSLVFTATMKHAARQHGTTSTYGGVFGLLATLTDTMTVIGPLAFLNAYGAVGMRVFGLMALVGVVFGVLFAAGVRPGPTRGTLRA